MKLEISIRKMVKISSQCGYAQKNGIVYHWYTVNQLKRNQSEIKINKHFM